MTHKWAPDSQSGTMSVQTHWLQQRETRKRTTPAAQEVCSTFFRRPFCQAGVSRPAPVEMRRDQLADRMDARIEVARILRHGWQNIVRKRTEACPRKR